MIKVRINETERELEEINYDWIHDQINNRYSMGISVCVVIKIKQGGINLSVSAGNNPAPRIAGRNPNEYEEEIFSLWRSMGVEEIPVNSARLIAFLQQVEKFSSI